MDELIVVVVVVVTFFSEGGVDEGGVEGCERV